MWTWAKWGFIHYIDDCGCELPWTSLIHCVLILINVIKHLNSSIAFSPFNFKNDNEVDAVLTHVLDAMIECLLLNDAILFNLSYITRRMLLKCVYYMRWVFKLLKPIQSNAKRLFVYWKLISTTRDSTYRIYVYHSANYWIIYLKWNDMRFSWKIW